MSGRWSWALLLSCAAVAVASSNAAPVAAQVPALPPLPAPAPAPPTPVNPIFLGADISAPGEVALAVQGPPGAVAVYYELVGAKRIRLGERVLGTPDQSLLKKATEWRCDRLVRRFQADVRDLDGTRYTGYFSVRTPSCRDRFKVSVPRRVVRGANVTVSVRDTWRTGNARPRVCVAAPHGKARCKVIAFRRGQATARTRVKATKRGVWRVRLRLGSVSERRSFEVGEHAPARRPPEAPVVLASGDSTLQGVDGFLGDRLGHSARVVSRIRPGTGISKPDPISWLKYSRIQSSTVKPDATVVSIGANDGFALRTPAGKRVPCCGTEWGAEYSRRVRIMMRTWSRFGGHVAWMTLSVPGIADLAPAFATINAAIERAAVGLPRVSIVRIDSLLSPGGTHQRTVMYRGRRVALYLRDGVHFSPAGTSIAAAAVAAELRRTGALAHRRR